MPNYLSLFSGIGGMDLGLDRAGWTCVGQVELDPFCRSVLARHWPEVPRHDDVRTCVDWWRGAARPAVDLVCGGFPCQPVSTAGARLAQDDPRWLWPHMARVIGTIRPAYAIMENVPGLFTAGFGDVVGDLAALGYDAEWGVLSACAVGAPHSRERVFIVAYAHGVDWRPAEPCLVLAGPETPSSSVGASGRGRGDGSHWNVEPGMGRVVDRIPNRMDADRLRGLGNAVVPQVAQFVGEQLLGAVRSRV